MNVEAIKKVRRHLGKIKARHFDMSDFFVLGDGEYTEIARKKFRTNGEALEGSCGTAACIAGHALALLLPTEPIPADPEEAARKLFGLSREEGHDLFVPHYHTNDRTTRAQAVRVLDHLLATGEVDWNAAIAEPVAS